MGRWAWIPLIATALLGIPGAQAAEVEHVFIVTIDGLRPDVLRNAPTPNIDNLIGVGAYSYSAQTVKPSVTLPAHCSLVSGLLPEGHGVTWNTDRAGYEGLSVPTIFTVGREHGLRSAVFAGKPKLRILARPGVLETFSTPGADAESVGRAAADYIANRKPNICLVHFADVDSAGHLSGWGSPEQHEAMARCDTAIGMVLGGVQRAGIATKSVMIVTSDHGGKGQGHGSSDPLDMTIPWVCAGKGVAARHELRTAVSVCDTAAMALWALGIAPPPEWDGQVISGVFPRRDASAARWATRGGRQPSPVPLAG